MDDGRLVPTPGPLVQLEGRRIADVALARSLQPPQGDLMETRLARPPHLSSRRGQMRAGEMEAEDTDSTKYNETGSLTDNKLDSEILSFFWAGEDREVLLASDETVRGGTRRALGQEITPDSGVVVTCLISS